MAKPLPPTLKLLIVGAMVLVVMTLAWMVLTSALYQLFHWRSAPMIAIVIIVVAGWCANGVLAWVQLRRGRSPPP